MICKAMGLEHIIVKSPGTPSFEAQVSTINSLDIIGLQSQLSQLGSCPLKIFGILDVQKKV